MTIDPMQIVTSVDEVLARTENPSHRAMLDNYRQHSILEIIGLGGEIFDRGLMVPEPTYRIQRGAEMNVIRGEQAVRELYESIARTVIFGWPEEHRIAVADWGIAATFTANILISGRGLGEEDARYFADDKTTVDPDSIYQVSWRQGMFWPYEDGRCGGEDVFTDEPSRTVARCDPARVVTREQVAAVLLPLIS